ncbi:hypothetical protein JIN77_15985 [Verrucomicrobiaceae bacterium R5-34]|nr:hypothetical protein [Verrucomicrobiaceae bacterium R5-34]
MKKLRFILLLCIFSVSSSCHDHDTAESLGGKKVYSLSQGEAIMVKGAGYGGLQLLISQNADGLHIFQCGEINRETGIPDIYPVKLHIKGINEMNLIVTRDQNGRQITYEDDNGDGLADYKRQSGKTYELKEASWKLIEDKLGIQ